MTEIRENYSKKTVTLIAYLLGTKDEYLADFDQVYLDSIKDNEDINLIRTLSGIRLNFLLNFDKILNKKKVEGALAVLENMEYFKDYDVQMLRKRGIEPFEYGVGVDNFLKHIANINEYIEENIDSVRKYFCTWVEWDYVRNIFIMPDARSGINGEFYKNPKKAKEINERIHALRKNYYKWRNVNFYPYGIYLNWPDIALCEGNGNILVNDSRFFHLLYEANFDTFKADTYVIDAKAEVKEDFYTFLNNANKVAFYVDCENVNPYSLVAAILNLDKAKLKKVSYIRLFDDVNTSNAWDMVDRELDIPVEHKVIDRVMDQKSLIDMSLAVGVMHDLYKNDIESVVLVSSDSDFWSLIAGVPDVKFFVMNESFKTSPDMLAKLDASNVPHCFIDKFSKAKIEEFKNKVLISNLQKILDDFNSSMHMSTLSVDKIVSDVFFRSGLIDDSLHLDQDKDEFRRKYIEHGIKVKIVSDEHGVDRFNLCIDVK